MEIIAGRGSSQVRTAQIARELHCSESTLYKIAPSKDSLIVLAIGRRGELALEALEARALKAARASDRAREYFRAGARATHSLSLDFYADIARFESTRLAWSTRVVEPYLDRFVGDGTRPRAGRLGDRLAYLGRAASALGQRPHGVVTNPPSAKPPARPPSTRATAGRRAPPGCRRLRR